MGIGKGVQCSPMRDASSRCVLQSTWSMGLTVPSLRPLFWILRMLATLDMRITESVHASVFTVDGPLPVFTWSTTRIASSRSGPTFTIINRATTPSANSTTDSDSTVPLCHQADMISQSRLGHACSRKRRFSAKQLLLLPFFCTKFRNGGSFSRTPHKIVSHRRRKITNLMENTLKWQ
jgi:hypothetical protein